MGGMTANSEAKSGQDVLLIGLHITKCAGTTLAETVRAKLPAREVYLCSSFWNTAQDAAPELFERIDLDKVKFIFGHFVHESLLKIYAHRHMIWFTGVREPVSRAVSEYYQICRVLSEAKQPPISADDFFRIRRNTMCEEFLRAFPTIGEEAPGRLADKAFAVAEVFDLIYGAENFESSVKPLLDLLGLTSSNILSVNKRDPINEHYASFFEEQEKLILEIVQTYFDEDIVLYERLKPYLGIWQPFPASSDDMRPRGRVRWAGRILERSSGLQDFIVHLADHYVRDFSILGRTAELLKLLDRKQMWLQAVCAAVDRQR